MAKSSFSAARSYAEQLDNDDSLRNFRLQFIIPTKADLKRKSLAKPKTQDGPDSQDEAPSIYLCGNSLGLQPRHLNDRIQEHLTAWATKGVFGHFKGHEDSDLAPFLHVDEQAAEKLAPIVGALKSEVAPMETLTANLHLLMASFYRPTKERYKIIIEGKAFPSDHYAVESQVKHHNLDPSSAVVILTPNAPSVTLTTASILSTITEHASSTALILLPGIQYYTGQYFDVKTITAHAHSLGITIGWDMAHAAGNVPLQLHDWDVDFAAWCNYKYINAGPGAVGGLFVHERHGKVDMTARERGEEPFRPRLSGWWGGEKAIRFMMGKDFVPIPGAAGFQVGNPPALALVALLASLETFFQTNMIALRQKSILITSYLEALLLESLPLTSSNSSEKLQQPLYSIITPPSPEERGAQLSVRILPGMLDGVMEELEANGVVVDERKPDVVRVAPTPLYNTFQECWEFVRIFKEACMKAEKALEMGKTVNGGESVMDKYGGTE